MAASCVLGQRRDGSYPSSGSRSAGVAIQEASSQGAASASNVSWGDPLNFCQVRSAEIHGDELVVIAVVVGIVQDAERAVVVCDNIHSVRGCACAEAREMRECECKDGSLAWEVYLAFAGLPLSCLLRRPQDLTFCYAPGYTAISIANNLSGLPAENAQPSRPPATANIVLEREFDEMDFIDEAECLHRWQLEQQLQFQREPRGTKREDGFRTPQRASPPQKHPQGPIPPSDAFYAAAQASHGRVLKALQDRLRGVHEFRLRWAAGDWVGLAAVLEASWDGATVAQVLRLLSSEPQQPPHRIRTQQPSMHDCGSSRSSSSARQPKPLPPNALAKLLPVAQRLAQADCEDHAVAAMRFVLSAIEVSWPPVARALRTVATPKATYDACEEAVQRLAALSAMSRSVKISRTSNGPLVPLCRKLKTALEEALHAAGRGGSSGGGRARIAT